MRQWRWYSKVLFALLVAAFAYWVWPTPWRYEKVQRWGEETLIRVNRFTGQSRQE
jgi:hypothetical protein